MNDKYWFEDTKNASLFAFKDGKYEEIAFIENPDIQIEDELSHRPDLISAHQSFKFSGEIEFQSSLLNYVRLFGFRYGVKVWLQTKFRKKR